MTNVGEPKARENLQALMARAVRGDAHPKDTANEYHKPWTVVDARRAVDVEVGKELRVGHKQAKTVRKELTSAIAKAVADLPPKKAEAIKKVVTAEVERQAKKLENTYADDVNAGINERLKDQLGPLTEARQAALKDAKRSQQIANDRLKGVPGLMTKAEFKLVLNCLHPDRAPADRREKFSEAFAVIKRLEDRTKWDE